MKITQATRRDTGKMVYLVQSQSDANHWHIVHRTMNGFECSCKDFTYRKSHRTSRRDCKHIYAVKMEILDAMNELGAKFLPPMKKEQPIIMQEQVIICKRCPRRCNGQTGLCYRCEQEQRKAEAQRREQAPLVTSQREFSIFKAS